MNLLDKIYTGGGEMKLILKENPNVELTVTIEYPKKRSQLSRIIQKLKSEEKALVGSENGRDYKVFMPDIFYIESVDKRTFIYTRDMVFRSEKRLYQLEMYFLVSYQQVLIGLIMNILKPFQSQR